MSAVCESRSTTYSCKCRCCFSELSDNDDSIQITAEIDELFVELTGFELKKPPLHSPIICCPCYNDLKYCTEFRRDLIAKQMSLTNLDQSEAEDQGVDGDEKPDAKADDNQLELEHYVDVKIERLDMLDELSECPHCQKLFDSTSIRRHINDKHSNKHSCTRCSYTTAKSTRLESHCLKYHNSDEPQSLQKSGESKPRKQCPTCGIFVKNLSEHQKMVHIQVKRFCCDFCNYSCYFKTKITRHIQRHIPKHLREQFPCNEPDCGFFATRKDALKSHILTMHQQSREKVCLCIECGKSFYNKSQLNIHVKAVHEKVKNHLCNLCGKSFFNVKDMEMHVKRHGVKDQACDICGNLFYCSLDLRRHLKIHQEPTIACDVQGCNRRFYTNSKLKMHIKIRHEGAKDFFCDYCSSRFSQYNNLKRHVNSVHKSLRINCLIPGCNYSVARKDKYKNHLASQHKFLDDQTKESILKSAKFQ